MHMASHNPSFLMISRKAKGTWGPGEFFAGYIIQSADMLQLRVSAMIKGLLLFSLCYKGDKRVLFILQRVQAAAHASSSFQAPEYASPQRDPITNRIDRRKTERQT
jgi:hypothetical protein